MYSMPFCCDHTLKMKYTETIILDHPLNCCKTKKCMKSKISSNIAREDEDINIMSNGKDTQFPKQHGNQKQPSLRMVIWSTSTKSNITCDHLKFSSDIKTLLPMERIIWKTKSAFSLRTHGLHKTKSTPNLPPYPRPTPDLPPYPRYPPPTPVSLSITKLEHVQDKMAQEIDLMPDGTRLDTSSPLDRFMAAVARRNATYLLLRQLPYAIWSNRSLRSSRYSHDHKL